MSHKHHCKQLLPPAREFVVVGLSHRHLKGCLAMHIYKCPHIFFTGFPGLPSRLLAFTSLPLLGVTTSKCMEHWKTLQFWSKAGTIGIDAVKLIVLPNFKDNLDTCQWFSCNYRSQKTPAEVLQHLCLQSAL